MWIVLSSLYSARDGTSRAPTRGELNRVLHFGRGYTRSGQGAGQTRTSQTRLSDQPGAGNQLVDESTSLRIPA